MDTFYSEGKDWPEFGMSYLFEKTFGLQEVNSPDDADVIIWNGGEDIGTALYGELCVKADSGTEPSSRDLREVELYYKFKGQPKKLLLGICRGAQFLHVMNGGKLYQDVNNHNGEHKMIDLRSREILTVTSTHHQQMAFPPESAEIIGVSSRSTYKETEKEEFTFDISKNILDGQDLEILCYPSTHTMCIQGHPEYVPNSRFAAYTLSLLNEFWDKIIKKGN